jgi:ring-1,2-phenylacetyl-CoA epoxidase subunit PaaE
MIHFHLLKVEKVERETDDCVSITFAVPADLKNTFQFKQGQSLTIRKELNGEEVRRTYSICSSPFDHVLKVAVKRQEGGIFSTYANEQLRAGDYLEVMPPIGNFYTNLDPLQKKNYVAFVAGSGITPVLSIIKTTLVTEPQSTFTLVYGNRTKTNIIFKEELEGLKDKFISRFCIYHILSREKTEAEINYGRIDRAKCTMLFDKLIDVKTVDEFFLCGPEAMIFSVRDFLLDKGVFKEHIHFELFTVPGEQRVISNMEEIAQDNKGQVAKVSVKLDGILFDFDLPFEGPSILDAALEQGADLPYACKGGVCTTCKAKLAEGKVEMAVNWGLEEEEVEKGYILTCQSHPVSERIIVDFDDR